ncbi:fungal-specific transcription factor domain-containing protein [Aspergillus floccosus]
MADEPHSNVAADMVPVLDALRSVVNVQKQQNETLESSNPFSKTLPSGLSFKNLPIPSMDRILACLRIAHEHSPTEVYWPFEFGSLGDFTQYVVKACSPGPVTDMELVIVHYGLHLLFTECSGVLGDAIAKQEHEAQALICRNSLETILSNLPFHISTSLDSLRAMYMATVYCLQRGKPFAAWAFISRASLMSQALGLHNDHVMAIEPAEEAEKKIRLFWALYVLEKAVSLRLGRPSTIRDRDITVPRPLLDRRMTSLLHNRLPDWVTVASLYGRVHDHIYSPSALAQPVSIRESRTRALASELERIIAARSELYKRPDQWTSHVAHPVLRRFIIHANLATDYSILAAIYRGIPAGKFSSFAPCPECIAAAKAALKETELCITTLGHAAPQSSSLDLWVNEILLLAPFMPFLILFCNIVRTSDPSDLAHLQGLVESLQSMAQSPCYSACSKQLRIFKALYEVAAKYVEAKARRRSMGMVDGRFTDFDINTHTNNDNVWCSADSSSTLLFTAPEERSLDGDQPLEAASSAGITQDESQRFTNQMSDFQSCGSFLAMQSRVPDDLGTELDMSGVQLGSWFHQSHQMMGFLDDI